MKINGTYQIKLVSLKILIFDQLTLCTEHRETIICRLGMINNKSWVYRLFPDFNFLSWFIHGKMGVERWRQRDMGLKKLPHLMEFLGQSQFHNHFSSICRPEHSLSPFNFKSEFLNLFFVANKRV